MDDVISLDLGTTAIEDTMWIRPITQSGGVTIDRFSVPAPRQREAEPIRVIEILPVPRVMSDRPRERVSSRYPVAMVLTAREALPDPELPAVSMARDTRFALGSRRRTRRSARRGWRQVLKGAHLDD